MEIKEGLSEKNIKELISYANSDSEIQKFTSDLKRFKDRESFDEWLKKGRKIYSLVDKEDDLLGIVWFGEEGDGFTLAIRMYGEARGRGLAGDFLKKTMANFMKKKLYVGAKNKSWWLETSQDNLAAIKVYEKLGFKLEGQGESPGKLIFRRPPGFESEKK